MITAGVMGASGYMGGEVIRVLLNHPKVSLQWAGSRRGGSLYDDHPNLFGETVNLVHPRDATPCDVVFLALPTGASLDAVEHWLSRDCKVIDLGAAFRLKDRATWERVYAMEHPLWHRVQEAVYGVTELHGDEVAASRLVANPGCFSSAAILGVAPLVKHDVIDVQNIVINGLSGTAGMGAALSHAAHHPVIGNNAVAYNVVDHRHSYEMEQELGLVAGKPVTVHFTPVYVPMVRGILNICYTFPKHIPDRDEVLQWYKDFYSDQPFVRIYDRDYEAGADWQYKPYPFVHSVTGTNYCYIGVDVDKRRRRIVTFSVLDSLGKGGAQVGVENMNRMFGLDPTVGLTARAANPI